MQELLTNSPKSSANHFSPYFQPCRTPVRLIFIWFLSKLWWSSNCLKTVFWKVASTAVMHYKIKVLCFDRITCQGKIFPEPPYKNNYLIWDNYCQSLSKINLSQQKNSGQKMLNPSKNFFTQTHFFCTIKVKTSVQANNRFRMKFFKFWQYFYSEF